MSQTLTLRRRAHHYDELPQPPDDHEKYWYMGRQQRWLLAVQAISFALIAYSILRFATADLRLLLFLLPMSLYAITLFISLLSSGRKKRTDRFDHEARVETWRPAQTPSVDVFLPSAGEPLDILWNTYSYVSGLQWAGPLNVYVLDDSARGDVFDMANDFGFHYLTRPDRGHLKKAGNLRFGYEHSTGDYILILDADFVPRRDALSEILPYFEDPSVGIVQTPQFFDTHKGMNWLQRCAGATQELFYRWIQPGRDSSKAAICVGTCAVYRRQALLRAGGFAQIGHSEDVHTGVNMMKAGYHVQYVPILVSKGLCPDTVAAFLNQQYRWCTGSMSLLADREFHTAKHISFRQRLSFWSGFLYYISTGLNAFIAPLPALAMLYFLPKWIEPMNSIWLLGALALWFVILPLTMKSRWRVTVLRVQTLYSFAHAVAIVDILSGRTKEWVATGAASRSTPLSVTIGRTAKTYIALSYGLLWFGLARGSVHYGLHQFWAMIVLALISSYVHLPLLFVSTGQRNRPQVHVPQQRIMPPSTAPIPVLTDVTTPLDMKPEAPGQRRFRPDIQGLRAIAVTLVVLYHAGVPVVTGGYIGVDVFFVISGFLITGQLLREIDKTGRIHFWHFYANRMRRLIPPAALVLLVSVLVARLYGSAFQFKSIATHAMYTAGYLINYRLAHENVNYQNANGPISPLQHFWSLAVEEQFYFLWPLIMMCCVWAWRRRAHTAVTSALLAITAISIYFSVTITKTDAPLAYFSLHTRAWELAAGALIAMAAQKLVNQPAWFARAASWLGVGMIVASAFVYNDSTAFPGTAALLPIAGAVLAIAGGCRLTKGSAEYLLDRKPFQGIGAVSYSWYLWHWPAIILAPFIFGRGFSWPENLELMVITLWIATLSYWMIESPTRRSQLRKVLWTSAGLGMSATTALVAFVLILTAPPLVGQGAAAVTINLDKGGIAAVQRAVGLATQTTKVPSNLTPSLDEAATDQPASSKNGCHLDYTIVIIPNHCLYGDRVAGKHTAVLVGDSHAQQWLPGLDKSARDNHWKLYAWTKAACPFADVQLYSTILKRNFTECDSFRQEVIAKIKATKPDLVIVSQSNSVPGNGVTNPQWAEKSADSIGEIQSAHIPVIYIGDTPYHGTNVPECLAKNLNDVGSCTLKRAYAEPYKDRAELLQQTLTATNVTYLDPTNWFCTNRDCPAVVGNLLVYRDESHISTAYSYYLAPLFKSVFTQ